MTIRFAPSVPLPQVREAARFISCDLVNDGRGDIVIQPIATRAGDCETCGHWDGHLVLGMCAECRGRYGVAPA